ncbi:MAG: class I SAM-dependent methyltransferase [Planctomycetes bacterium]|nr:class I SAM-dependent methyltransferase [Planctomycetota bacterium]
MTTPYRASFAPAVEHYVHSTSHADPVSLARMCALTGAVRGQLALDVACGGGHSTWALAQAGCRVVALDGTPEMLKACGGEGRKRGLTFDRALGDAHRFPFRHGVFDIVVCRIAAHHFANPLAALREMSRVMHRKSRLYIYDLSAPDSEAMGRWIDAVESLRDPSHVCCWSSRAWEGLAIGAGLRIVHSARYRRQYDMENWLGRMGVKPDVRQAIRERVKSVPPSWWDDLSVEVGKEPPVFGTPLLEFVAEKF